MASAAEGVGRDSQRYSSVAIVFHWLIAALIVLHVAGALKHYAQGHRHLTARMAPWLGGTSRT